MSRIEYSRLRSDQREPFLELMQAAFGIRELFLRYFEHDPNLCESDCLVAFDGARIVSAVQVYTRSIRLFGEVVPVGGIGGVGTHPDYEGRGLASALLCRAIDEMNRREMMLSLLFSTRTRFYGRLGWVLIPHPVAVAHPHPKSERDRVGRLFVLADLPAAKKLHARYSGARDVTAVRDDEYWIGQLAFGGNPDETFRVFERDGEIVAYARLIEQMTIQRITEYGRGPGAAGDLAPLVLDIAPAGSPLFVPGCGDAELNAALVSLAAQVDWIEFPDAMWRVLDRPGLQKLCGQGGSVDDADLLAKLIDREDTVFWPSDRF